MPVPNTATSNHGSLCPNDTLASFRRLLAAFPPKWRGIIWSTKLSEWLSECEVTRPRRCAHTAAKAKGRTESGAVRRKIRGGLDKSPVRCSHSFQPYMSSITKSKTGFSCTVHLTVTPIYDLTIDSRLAVQCPCPRTIFGKQSDVRNANHPDHHQ